MDAVVTKTLCESKRETGRLISVSERTVDRMIANGELKIVKTSGRVLVLRSSLESWVRRNAR
jgi:excisionase family DNA binding protein